MFYYWEKEKKWSRDGKKMVKLNEDAAQHEQKSRSSMLMSEDSPLHTPLHPGGWNEFNMWVYKKDKRRRMMMIGWQHLMKNVWTRWSNVGWKRRKSQGWMINTKTRFTTKWWETAYNLTLFHRVTDVSPHCSVFWLNPATHRPAAVNTH